MKTSAEYMRIWRGNNPERDKENRLRYYRENKERINTRQRNYYRKNYIGTAGGKIRVVKRVRPDDVCEVCGSEGYRLNYHHWDGTNPKLGVWVCRKCHFFVEEVDRGNVEDMLEKYLYLKRTVSRVDSLGLFNDLLCKELTNIL